VYGKMLKTFCFKIKILKFNKNSKIAKILEKIA
jgi:hypothetical protein